MVGIGGGQIRIPAAQAAEQEANVVFKENLEGANPQLGTSWANNVKSWKANFVAKPDGTYDFTAMKRVLDIYKEEGMDQSLIVVMTSIPTYQFVKTDTEELRQKLLQQTRSMTRALVKFQKKNGYPQLAVYGIDEATGERLAKEKDIFKAILDEGGMTTAAVTSGFYPAIGDLLTLPILSYPDPSASTKVHAAGHQI